MSQRRQLVIRAVQKDLGAERKAIKDFVQGDPLPQRFFTVVLCEDMPASGRSADTGYLREVDDLVEKGLLERRGDKRGAHDVLK